MLITDLTARMSLTVPQSTITNNPLLLDTAGQKLLEVQVNYHHILLLPGPTGPESVPIQALTMTVLAPRREFFALGPTSFGAMLWRMGALMVDGIIPDRFIDESLGPLLSDASHSIDADPAGLGAAPVLNLCLEVFARTTPLEWSLAAMLLSSVDEFVDSLEEADEVGGGDDCSICLEQFGTENDDDVIVRTPCGHVYHKACIARWLKTNPLCPLCRYCMPIC